MGGRRVGLDIMGVVQEVDLDTLLVTSIISLDDIYRYMIVQRTYSRSDLGLT